MKTLPVINTKEFAPMAQRKAGEIRVGQLNAHNLFDTKNDSSTQDTILKPGELGLHLTKLSLAIRDAMGAPDIVTMQEVENIDVLKKLCARKELKDLGYKPMLIDGTDPRGIDNAILYRDTVTLQETHVLDPVQATETGRQAHLFTRPPVVARFGINGRENARKGIKEITVVAAHLTSKLGQEKAAAKRQLQAQQLADVATWVGATSPQAAVIITGDLNMEREEPEFAPLRNGKQGAALHSLVDSVPSKDRFTWRDGRKHLMLDHMLGSQNINDALVGVTIPHISTQIAKDAASDPVRAEGVSDHDPIVATFKLNGAKAKTAPPEEKTAAAAAA